MRKFLICLVFFCQNATSADSAQEPLPVEVARYDNLLNLKTAPIGKTLLNWPLDQ